MFTIFIFALFSGCVSYKDHRLSSFTLNSKKANSRIVDRYPDYGDGHKDGCLVMEEMHSELKTDKAGQVEGKISDVHDGRPLSDVLVIVKTDLQQDIQLTTDSLGLFRSKILGKLKEAQLVYPGYRRMIIRL